MPILGRFGFLDERFRRHDDDDTGIGDREAAGEVGFGSKPMTVSFGEMCTSRSTMVRRMRQWRQPMFTRLRRNGFGDLAEAVDAHIAAESTSLNAAAGDDGPPADDGVDGHAHAAALLEDEFGGALGLRGCGSARVVVEVQLRSDRNEVHVGFVVGVERAHVAPVRPVFRFSSMNG